MRKKVRSIARPDGPAPTEGVTNPSPRAGFLRGLGTPQEGILSRASDNLAMAV